MVPLNYDKSDQNQNGFLVCLRMKMSEVVRSGFGSIPARMNLSWAQGVQPWWLVVQPWLDGGERSSYSSNLQELKNGQRRLQSASWWQARGVSKLGRAKEELGRRQGGQIDGESANWPCDSGLTLRDSGAIRH